MVIWRTEAEAENAGAIIAYQSRFQSAVKTAHGYDVVITAGGRNDCRAAILSTRLGMDRFKFQKLMPQSAATAALHGERSVFHHNEKSPIFAFDLSHAQVAGWDSPDDQPGAGLVWIFNGG